MKLLLFLLFDSSHFGSQCAESGVRQSACCTVLGCSGVVSTALAGQAALGKGTPSKHVCPLVYLRGGGLRVEPPKRRKTDPEFDLGVLECDEDTVAPVGSEEDSARLDTEHSSEEDTLSEGSSCFSPSGHEHKFGTTAEWCAAVDENLDWPTSDNLSELHSSEAQREFPEDWKPTLRDMKKFVKHIQRKNGVTDLDLNPPTGFDEMPDIMVIGGNSGGDKKDLAAAQSFNFATGRWRMELPMGFHRSESARVRPPDPLLQTVCGPHCLHPSFPHAPRVPPSVSAHTCTCDEHSRRHGAAAVRFHDRVFVFGGLSDDCPQVFVFGGFYDSLMTARISRK